MPTRYLQLPLASAKSGMTLSDAVLDTKGNILLPKGAVLTDATLASLLRHQIDTLVIAGSEVSPEQETAERGAQIARLNYLFRQPGSVGPATPRSDATATLQQTIVNFRSGTLS